MPDKISLRHYHKNIATLCDEARMNIRPHYAVGNVFGTGSRREGSANSD